MQSYDNNQKNIVPTQIAIVGLFLNCLSAFLMAIAVKSYTWGTSLVLLVLIVPTIYCSWRTRKTILGTILCLITATLVVLNIVIGITVVNKLFFE